MAQDQDEELWQLYLSGTPLAFVEASDWDRAKTRIRDEAYRHKVADLAWHPGLGYWWNRSQEAAPSILSVIQNTQIPILGDESAVRAIHAVDISDWRNEQRAVWLLLEGLEYFWRQPGVIFSLLNLQARLRQTHGMLIVLISNAGKLPHELAHAGPVVRVSRPNKAEAIAELRSLVRQNQWNPDKLLTSAQWSEVGDAVAGLTAWEIRRAGAASLQAHKTLHVDYLTQMKSQLLSQVGVLELVPSVASLDQIGGLESLKEWAMVRRRAFTPEAQKFGLPVPKGVLALGPPGTGKSLFAKALSTAWKFPLLRLDFGRVFGPYIGQSEAQLRDALAQAEAHAPVVLWIDEIEKGMAGATGPSGDSGTARRILGSFLTWMQEKSTAVFIVATANDVRGLPPEFLRKGRFDEIFFIDLPTPVEREAIWRVHLTRRGIDVTTVPLAEFVQQTDGFTGAEIEQAVVDALYRAFAGQRTVQADDWEAALTGARPISRVMGEQITALRKWASDRARPAGHAESA
jgi:ATP-dependent 26S proteasome regulatory subunit